MLRRNSFLILIFFLFSFIANGQETSLQDERFKNFRENLVGKKIKSFKLKGLNNESLESDKLKDKIIVINFWFTACKPCILEMPHLNKLVAENIDKSVVFIAPAPEEEPQIKKFLKKYSFDYNIIPASLDYINELKIENFPTHIIIDKKGIVKQVLIGYADDIKEKLQAEINKLL
jgi:thiol-disulfide isomerase/thioredoxin